MSELLKQGSNNSLDVVGLVDKYEISVSEILLDLPNLINSEWHNRFDSVCWGKKRRRSALDSPPTFTTSSPPSCRLTENETHVVQVIKKMDTTKVETAAVTAATSPSTPLSLSFSHSESDEHKSSKQSTKSNSKKKTKEELLEDIDGLNHQRELLKGEIDIARSKHCKLTATNMELKAKKGGLIICRKMENKPELGMNGGTIEQLYQSKMTTFAPQQKQQFLMDYNPAYKSKLGGNFEDLYGQRAPMEKSPYQVMGSVNQMGPRGIPDLNVCVEETSYVLGASSQPLDLIARMVMENNSSRFRAAEARRRRILKIKEAKNHRRSQSQRQHVHLSL